MLYVILIGKIYKKLYSELLSTEYSMIWCVLFYLKNIISNILRFAKNWRNYIF